MTYSRSLPRTRHWPRATGLVSLVKAAFEAKRQRHALSQLDERSLRDIGITPEEAREEAMRAAWDVPDSWRVSCLNQRP